MRAIYDPSDYVLNKWRRKQKMCRHIIKNKLQQKPLHVT